MNTLKPQPELFKLVERIRDAGRHGAELTRRLLAFARQQPLEIQEVDLIARIRNATSRPRQPLRPDIALKFDLVPALGPVRTDPVQLETALLNLVINARDALPQVGAITISARSVAGDRTSRRLKRWHGEPRFDGAPPQPPPAICRILPPAPFSRSGNCRPPPARRNRSRSATAPRRFHPASARCAARRGYGLRSRAAGSRPSAWRD